MILSVTGLYVNMSAISITISISALYYDQKYIDTCWQPSSNKISIKLIHVICLTNVP